MDPIQPVREAEPRRPSTSGSAAQAADILALGRAALDVIGRALRSSPEVRSNRVMARWPLDLEDLLLELEPMQHETPITELAARLGVSTAQLRSTALRLQRLTLVKVSSAGVSLTPTGRQKLARLEMARAAVLRRIARGFEVFENERSKVVIEALGALLEQAERVVEEQLGAKPEARRTTPQSALSANAGNAGNAGSAGTAGNSGNASGSARGAASRPKSAVGPDGPAGRA